MSTSRTIRVFLSSTFRDFAEERDLLVRTVFPELRRKCRERQVELVDVDLRWGITEKEAQKGKVLPICLAEIDRSRPYFIGCLAERYGWIPAKEQYDVSLLVEQPWLEEHLGSKSVTELEILHGVLNNPAMAGQAFFYFRDSRYAQKKGAAYLSAGQDEKVKIEALKARIRSSGFPVLENYRNPEVLAKRVKEDLWRMIDAAYPESEVPDALILERRKHEAYGASRLRLYLGGERYFKMLDGAMSAKIFAPVLVTGQSGGGKSALLANWLNRWSIQHPKTAVVVHHLGSGADAADPVRIVVRLIQEIAKLTGEEFRPESDPEKQLEQLPLWLAAASAWAQRCERELLLVLDGLDKLSDRKHLRWFPVFLPPKVKLVASCLDGEILQAAEGRFKWKQIMVRPFVKTAQKRLIKEHLWRFRKSLTPEQSRLLQSHPLSGNPLFLLTVLEELRVFGVHEEIEQRLARLLSPPPSKKPGEEPTVDDAFEHVLARIEEDIGRRRVQRAMEAIWASRAGLFSDELLGTAKLAPAHWAAIQNALDEALYESGGRINFGHDYLRKAVEDRYGLRGRKRRRLHRRLAEWFARWEVDERIAEELPWQWREAGDKEALEYFLLNLGNLSVMKSAYIEWIEVHHYWTFCGGEDGAQKYLPILTRLLEGNPSTEELNGCQFLSKIAERSRWLFTSVSISRIYCELLSKKLGSSHLDTLRSKAGLGNQLIAIWSEETHEEAENLLRNTYNTCLEILGREHLLTIEVESDFGSCLSQTQCRSENTLLESESLLEEAVSLGRRMLGETHRDTLVSKNNLAILYWRMKKFKKALKILRMVVAETEIALGNTHPDTLICLNNLAAMLRDHGFNKEAENIFRSLIPRMENVFGLTHRDTLLCLQDLGMLLNINGDSKGSSDVIKEIFRRRGLVYPDPERMIYIK